MEHVHAGQHVYTASMVNSAVYTEGYTRVLSAKYGPGTVQGSVTSRACSEGLFLLNQKVFSLKGNLSFLLFSDLFLTLLVDPY